MKKQKKGLMIIISSCVVVFLLLTINYSFAEGPDSGTTLLHQFYSKVFYAWTGNMETTPACVNKARALVDESYAEVIKVVGQNVAIGDIASPAVKLDINGAVKLSDITADCTVELDGVLRYHEKKIELCTNGAWTNLALGTCTKIQK